MSRSTMPAFPYGAVYFRKSNPPRQDWQRDYRAAAEDGMNAFRHWFMWGAIEVAPGKFDWADYDRQMDLGAEAGIKTVIAEMLTIAPDWAYRQLPEARLESVDGRKANSAMHVSSAIGGAPGLCPDHEAARELGERFLRELVTRYRHHRALGAYDVWNECGYPAEYCYCPATAAKFRAWLRARYGTVETLAEAWLRPGISDWEDAQPPRHGGGYPDVMDWLEFRVDNAYQMMRWRVQLIRELDPGHPITAHGVAMSLAELPARGTDDWRAAAEVDSYGFTWVASRQGDQPWKQWHAVDLVRGSARGKPFWHAEAQGGPLWLQPQVPGRPREDGRITAPEDIRVWNLTSFAGGVTGYLYPRWRPLLDGPLFGAFGAYGMDGSRTSRSQMVSRIARWATDPEQARLWEARPVQGDIGIAFVPESEVHNHAQLGNSNFYSGSARGAYQGFFENNIQADFVHLDDIAAYDTLYLPYPVMLKQASADKLIRWVEQGGTLISEGCPGYFGDGGHVGSTQPNLGLNALFGVRESYVEFTPDLLEELTVGVGEERAPGGIFLQAYEPDEARGAQAVGWYDDGQVAVVDHFYGAGRTRLIGTFPGYGFTRQRTDASRRFFASLLAWARKQPHIQCSTPGLVARLHHGESGTYLWLVNHNRQPVDADVALSHGWGPFSRATVLWGEGGSPPRVEGRSISLTTPRRDATVLRLS